MTAVIETPTSEATFASIPLDEIIPSPDNVRTDLGDLDGLVASIASVGLIEPLAVERCATNDHADDHRFHILAGERRWSAARRAGLVEVPCMVRDAVTDDGARAELMLIENLQRQDLQPLEEARGYQRLVDLGLSQRTIAERVGCSQAHVSRRVALLELPAAVQRKVGVKGDPGGITVADAQELLKLKDHPKELAAAAKDGDVARAVDRRVKEIEAEEKLKKLTAEAKAKGWTVCKVTHSYGAKRTYWRLRKPGSYSYTNDDVEVDAAKHRKEPCHGVVIEKGYNGQVNQAEVCTARDRHKPKGESSLKLPKQERRQMSASERKAKEQARQRQDAGKRRAEALKAALAGRPDRGAWALVCEAIVPECHADTKKLACELLGLEPAPQGQWGGKDYDTPLLAHADQSVPDTLKVGLACALAAAEISARFPHHMWSDRPIERLYSFLEAAGYEPDEYERAELAKGRKEQAENDEGLARAAAFATTDVRTVRLSDGTWRVLCDHCGEDDEDQELVVEVSTEAQALSFRALHLTDLHEVRSCRVCSCTEDHACAGGCSWLSEDLCDSPACAAGAEAATEQVEEATETATPGGPITGDMPTITVQKVAKRWKATCSACGEIGANTSEAYADERGQTHIDLDHRLVDAEAPA